MAENIRIAYLVAATLDQGITDARSREGWTQIAHTRFVTPDKVDVRVVCRSSDMHPLAAMTPMIRGSDYDSGPAWNKDAWVKNREEIEQFVETGNGRWVDL